MCGPGTQSDKAAAVVSCGIGYGLRVDSVDFDSGS